MVANKVSLGLPSGGLPITSRQAQAEASGLPIASRVAEAAAAAGPAVAAKPAKPALKSGLPIASRAASAASEEEEQQQRQQQSQQVGCVAGSTCGGLPRRRQQAECHAQMVTTPLVRRSARRRSTRAISNATPTGNLPRWAQASTGDEVGSPASYATTATQATQCSFLRPVSRTDTQSTSSSVKWAPQALCRSWHGKLTETYSVNTIVGEGRSGAVFIVQHKKSLKYYACKVLNKDNHDAAALRGEIRTLRQLDHPNIVRLFETHEDGDSVFLLMELCHGGDLFDKIADEQTVSEPTAQIFAHQMASALAYCHAGGVIHRDIKPENFLLETEHPDCLTLKLADFGIATSIRPPHLAADPTPASKSRGLWPCVQDGISLDGTFGSLPYTAPEILRGKPPLAASDMWSLGVTIYVMLSGSLPFEDCPDRICGEAPDFSGEAWETISPEGIDLVRALLRPKPEDRLTAQQALAHEWFSDVSPLEAQEEASPTDLSSNLDDLTSDQACMHRLAKCLVKNLRRWRKMPKLRRIAIAAIAKRLEGQHDAHRLADTVYTFFNDSTDSLRCDRLVQMLSSTLGGGAGTPTPFGAAFHAQRSASSLPGMPAVSPMAQPGRNLQRTFSRTMSGTFTGLQVRQRLRNSLRRLAGTPVAADCNVQTPEAEVNLAELRYLVSSLDGMKDGTVDFTLLVASMLPAEVYGDGQHVAEVFALFDVQQRGKVSPGDIRVCLKSQERDINHFAAMLAQFDQNGDGALDFAEFRNMIAGGSLS